MADYWNGGAQDGLSGCHLFQCGLTIKANTHPKAKTDSFQSFVLYHSPIHIALSVDESTAKKNTNKEI